VATKEGSIIFGSDFVLENVLYVPGLSCNLISMSQLIYHSNCTIQLTHNMCVIQNRTSRKLIGDGERQSGFYYFKGIPLIMALKVDKGMSLDLWHQRLGHRSIQATKIISGVDLEKDTENLNKCCDVCQRAKQMRNKFPTSDFRASNAFELIHYYLWGSYRNVSSCGAFYFLTIIDDYSRVVLIYLLIDKNKVSSTLKMFFSIVKC